MKSVFKLMYRELNSRLKYVGLDKNKFYLQCSLWIFLKPSTMKTVYINVFQKEIHAIKLYVLKYLK